MQCIWCTEQKLENKGILEVSLKLDIINLENRFKRRYIRLIIWKNEYLNLEYSY